MKRSHYKVKAIFSHPMRYLFPLFLASVFLFVGACQQSSDNEVSSGNGSSGGDSTAPTTSLSSSSCSFNLSARSISCSSTSPSITLRANETSTIYYNTGSTSSVSVSTSAYQGTLSTSGTITMTGSESGTQYLALFARDSAGNQEAVRTFSVFFQPAPTSSLTVDSTSSATFVNNYCSYDESGDTGRIYTCVGTVNVTLSADSTANGETIYYGTGTTLSGITATDTGVSSMALDISEDSTYLKFYAKTAAGKAESEKSYLFRINGIVAVVNNSGTDVQLESGYYSSSQSFKYKLSEDDRKIFYNYQIWYNSSSDASSDTSSIFSGSPLTPNPASTLYYSEESEGADSIADPISPLVPTDTTSIYQYKYNLLYSDTGSLDATEDYISDGSADSEASLVLYMDGDAPTMTLLPPSSGSLDDSISIKAFVFDKGHEKVERYRNSNPKLPGYSDTNSKLPVENPSSNSEIFPNAWYCKPDSQYNYDESSFWGSCDSASSRTTIVTDSAFSVSSDTYFIANTADKANNDAKCDDSQDLFSCIETAARTDYNHSFLFDYTPGMQRSSIYHDEEFLMGVTNVRNFGYSIAVGNLDGDGVNDIIIGAPSNDATTDGNPDARGAVYVWYDEFRERPILTFSLSDSSFDISDRYMQFKTDGGNDYRVYLDPSTDTSAYSGYKYQTYVSPDDSTIPYSDKTRAKPTEIAKVLNKAFHSSIDTAYKNHLYAIGNDSTSDPYLKIGHLNRTISGYFNYSSNFDSSSDLYRDSTADIKAYDYKIIGETAGSRFGYSVAVGVVDSTTDTGYSTRRIVVGAPGYNNNYGAVYIIRVPGNDASTDYEEIDLASDTSDAHRVYGTAEGSLGFALALHDRDGDNAEEIYVSAPYYDNTADSATNSGAVYEIYGRSYSYDATSDLDDASNDKAIWAGELMNGSNNDESNINNALFGYSLKIGTTEFDDNFSTTNTLYIGVPGDYSDASVKGMVRYVNLDASTLGLGVQAGHVTIKQPTGATSGDLFGYAIDIVNDSFNTNTSTPNICPCLVVGSPGTDDKNGTVWVLGDNFDGYVYGSSSEELGISVSAGEIGIIGSSTLPMEPVIVIGSTNASSGKVTTLSPQSLSGGTPQQLTADFRTYSGSDSGENVGFSTKILTLSNSSKKGLIIGAPGKNGSHQGMLNIYSPERLLSN